MAAICEPELRQQQRRPHPGGRPCMFQTWKDLLFLHWRCDPAVVQSVLPPWLTVDTYAGDAWIAIVPFLMRNIRPVWSPCAPHLSNFLELNIRTYAIDDQGTPGVWFTSLNANRFIAVAAARKFFNLPYFQARMSVTQNESSRVEYRCRRWNEPQESQSVFQYTPETATAPSFAAPGTLDFFLLERYLLFSQLRDHRRATGRVYHSPYPIHPVTLHRWDSRLLEGDRLTVSTRPPDHVAFSTGVSVEVFPLQVNS